MEDELFGHEREVFPGAYSRIPGRYEVADKGTLFLNEIGEMDERLQATLLQVLKDGKFRRIGGTSDLGVDVRIVVAATNRPIGRGLFCRDFLYRLDGIVIVLPTLEERCEDVPLLANYFVDHYNQVYDRQTPYISSVGINKIMNSRWRGNIRELENVVLRYVIFGQEDMMGK